MFEHQDQVGYAADDEIRSSEIFFHLKVDSETSTQIDKTSSVGEMQARMWR